MLAPSVSKVTALFSKAKFYVAQSIALPKNSPTNQAVNDRRYSARITLIKKRKGADTRAETAIFSDKQQSGVRLQNA